MLHMVESFEPIVLKLIGMGKNILPIDGTTVQVVPRNVVYLAHIQHSANPFVSNPVYLSPW